MTGYYFLWYLHTLYTIVDVTVDQENDKSKYFPQVKIEQVVRSQEDIKTVFNFKHNVFFFKYSQ